LNKSENMFRNIREYFYGVPLALLWWEDICGTLSFSEKERAARE
jgi:hypothetical protein